MASGSAELIIECLSELLQEQMYDTFHVLPRLLKV